ncbi:DUF599 family protein [Alteromonas sp. KUL49]|uniref:DUF599 domain-containing protein n=1 Tax=Alteromonas sp. KUL49 TaxID=2480798 RepID=UPI00102EF95C|nr:DUF599 family protein [Alteromonas sp. KUL49]TAP40120.1 DUF599 family protein [Alteromonas sp. KUL49]GEA11233.1 hypothetical protein KUL49_16080 [Alteromonas sp. KUL49]
MDKVYAVVDLLTWLDYLALVTFAFCWAGYRYYLEKGERGRRGLIGVTHEYRLQWAMESATRDIPVSCAALTTNLMNSVSFYANTTIYIIAGLLALVGTADRLLSFSTDIPFMTEEAHGLIELKLMLLILVFISAYFKFTWSLRQFNFLCILIGGTPHERNMPDKAFWERSAKRVAKINSIAGNEFNRGIRAYYFGIAALGWFVHPLVFIAATFWITLVVYRRDYHSKALKILRDEYPPELREIQMPPNLKQ